MKWIGSIEFVENFDHIGQGKGGYNEDHEYHGYQMPTDRCRDNMIHHNNMIEETA